MWFDRDGGKIFDIAFGSRTVVKDIDIYKEVGKSMPYDVFVPFRVKNQQIIIDVNQII